jgi:hypothetical protein
MPLPGEPNAPPKQNLLPRVAFVPRVGAMFWGWGTSRFWCTGDYCSIQERDKTAHTHDVGHISQLDVLVRLGRVMRLGPGLSYQSRLELDTAAQDDVVFGSELGANVVVEPAASVGAGVWIAPRGEVGLLIPFLAGKTRRDRGRAEEICYEKTADGFGCDSRDDGNLGGSIGVGAGTILELGDRLRLRADVFVRYYSYLLASGGSDSPYHDELTWKMSGLRMYVFSGPELP